MADKNLKNVTKVPLVKPGMDALGMTAPVLVQMNPEGKWENCKPKNMDEERLKAVVQHLVNSDAVSAVQSYCCQCAAESQMFRWMFVTHSRQNGRTDLDEIWHKDFLSWKNVRLPWDTFDFDFLEANPSEARKESGKSNYVPVIMMPIYSADQCPFDLECEVQKLKESETKPVKKMKAKEQVKQSEKEKDKKKIKKRAFVLQRLTDFDLLSQW